MPAGSETRLFNTLLTSTMDAYAGEALRNMLTSFPLIDMLARGGKATVKGGGARIDVPIAYGYNPGSQWFDGADVLDMTPFENLTMAKFDWKNLHAPITYTGSEVRKNKGAARMIDLVKQKIEDTELTLWKILEIAMTGDGMGSQGKVILGLDAFFPTTPTTDPAVGPLGGITVTGNPWWQNNARTGFGSFAANGPGGTANNDLLLADWMAISDGPEQPDLIISAPDVYRFYHEAVMDHTQIIINQTQDGRLSYQSLTFQGVPWIWSRTIPNGRAYLLRKRDLEFWVHSDANMTLGEFQKSWSQDLYGASMMIMCAFFIRRRMFSHVIDGITA